MRTLLPDSKPPPANEKEQFEKDAEQERAASEEEALENDIFGS